MRCLIIGLGSIGSRHLRNWRSLYPDAPVAVLRHGAASMPQEFADIPAFNAIEEALNFKPTVAILASPASKHVDIAQQLADHGIHLLIEKPLSDHVQGVDLLIETCREKSLVVQVGYHLRHHPSLITTKSALDDGMIGRLLSIHAEIGQYLPDWRPGTDYRQGVSAQKSLGGGAILELSHELDLVYWMAGDVVAVTARQGRLAGFDIDVEDTADILLDFQSGAMGNVHVDMVQRTPVRQCRLIGAEGSLICDLLSSEVKLYQAAKGEWETLCPEHDFDRNQLYCRELEQFVADVECGEKELTSLESGAQVLEIALAAKQSALENRTIDL